MVDNERRKGRKKKTEKKGKKGKKDANPERKREKGKDAEKKQEALIFSSCYPSTFLILQKEIPLYVICFQIRCSDLRLLFPARFNMKIFSSL